MVFGDVANLEAFRFSSVSQVYTIGLSGFTVLT